MCDYQTNTNIDRSRNIRPNTQISRKTNTTTNTTNTKKKGRQDEEKDGGNVWLSDLAATDGSALL